MTVRNVEDEVAAPRQTDEPGLGERPGHSPRRGAGLHGPPVEKTCRLVVGLTQLGEQHRRPIAVPLERAEGGRGHEGLPQGRRVGGGLTHDGRQVALKAIEIRGVSLAMGWTK